MALPSSSSILQTTTHHKLPLLLLLNKTMHSLSSTTMSFHSSPSSPSPNYAKTSTPIPPHLPPPAVTNSPTRFAITTAIKKCASTGDLHRGKEIHAYSITSNFISDIYIGTSLITMYAKCSDDILTARQVFDEMPERNVVSWSAMILGYAQRGWMEHAWEVFSRMHAEGVKGNEFTYTSMLSACSSAVHRDQGVSRSVGGILHCVALVGGFYEYVVVGNALLTMYAKRGELEKSQQVFDEMSEKDIVSWSAILAAYGWNGKEKVACSMFMAMLSEGVPLNMHTMASILSSCGELGDLELAMELHCLCLKIGLDRHVIVGNALVTGYSKTGELNLAKEVFERMESKDVVSWTSIIAAHAQDGDGYSALELFDTMNDSGVKPNEHTFINGFDACTTVNDLNIGKQIHAVVFKTGFDAHVFVANVLITFYSKCGLIEDAQRVFDLMKERDVSSWNAVIIGNAQHGRGHEGLRLFHALVHTGLKPDSISFIGVLSSCTHVGITEGLAYFEAMERDYNITPRMDHYGCVVDMLGRAGRLEEAKSFIEKMPFEPDPIIWSSLLASCKIHKNVELGRQVGDRLLQIEPDSTSTHVMLANLYASCNRWKEMGEVRKIMKDKGLEKTLGYSWLTIKNDTYSFTAGDTKNAQTKELYETWDTLVLVLKQAGYVPKTNAELHDVDDGNKEKSLGHHSEKLAIMFGLLNTPPRTSLHITKNIRVCGDCHSASKYISLVTNREIIMRDTIRFHHFKNGSCSCKDYW